MNFIKVLIVSKILGLSLVISSVSLAGNDFTPSDNIAKKAVVSVWMRVSSPLNYLKMSPYGNFLAFSDPNGRDLRVLEIRTAKIYEVSKHFVGPSLFWAPDDCRLFFTEQYKTYDEKVASALKTYDCSTKRSALLDTYSNIISFLTFDPREMKVHLLSKGSIHRKTINIANQRLDIWKVPSKLKQRRWIAAESGIFMFSNDGKNITKLDDDDSGVQSFDLSSDGENMVWATKQGNVFVSRGGDEPEKIGDGIDPKWHPNRHLIVYSAAKKLGSKIVDYDLAIADENNKIKFITVTPYKERWPNWNKDGSQIVFTAEGITDIFVADFQDL